MKMLKSQNFFNGSFGGIIFIRQSFSCMWRKNQMPKSVSTTQFIPNMENTITNSRHT